MPNHIMTAISANMEMSDPTSRTPLWDAMTTTMVLADTYMEINSRTQPVRNTISTHVPNQIESNQIRSCRIQIARKHTEYSTQRSGPRRSVSQYS